VGGVIAGLPELCAVLCAVLCTVFWAVAVVAQSKVMAHKQAANGVGINFIMGMGFHWPLERKTPSAFARNIDYCAAAYKALRHLLT
jgi:threonine/homoserine efflux transporter RhtA